MSKVALRVYNREIETLVDQGHIDEAIAHCQHILKLYPKHLETYRLLGKAFLEARRTGDAADIFQRVLSSVPDDFISHLGMSIISDEQKDLDGAIWHMERAFEVNPSNGGVQGELRRLYGRRDGLEPPKIRLTRGALAQMYTKGGQFPQAVAEIKSVLAEDASRDDMKVLLARAFYRSGQKVEATEICIDLLKQSPFCLDANRILVEVLPGTSLAQSLDTYKKRVQSLEPYAALATGSIFDTEAIPDNAVTLERLEWDPGANPISSGSSSGSSPDAIPDFLKSSGWGPSTGEFQEGPVDFGADESPAAASGANLAAAEIPDWLKAMAPPGQPATPAEPAAASSSGQDLAAEDLDWLSGLGGPVSSGAQPPAEGLAAATDQPDWLKGLGGNEAAGSPPAPAESAAPDAAPDWLKDLGGAEAADSQPTTAEPASSGDQSDWLNSLGGATPAINEPDTEPKPQPSVDESGDVPDWLQGLGGGVAAASAVAAATPQPAEPPSNAPDGIPTVRLNTSADGGLDWLKDLGGSQETSAPAAGQAVPADDMDWLKNLGGPAEEAAPSLPANSPSEPAAQSNLPDDMDWLKNLGGPADATPAPAQPESPVAATPAAPPPSQAKPEAKVPKDLSGDDEPIPPLSAPVSGPGTSESEQDDAMKWLESLAQKQGAKPEELITKPQERTESAPDWVAKVDSNAATPAAPVAPPKFIPEQPLEIDHEAPPGELSPLISGPGTSSSEQDDAMKWLESLAQKQGAKAEELITNPAERTETAPGWVDQVENPPTPLSATVDGPGTSAADQDDSMKWLENLAERQGAKPEELITDPAERIDMAPDWVDRVGAVTSQPVAPEQPVPTPIEMPTEPSPAADLPGSPLPEAAQDDDMKWLENLAASTDAPMPGSGTDDTPPWSTPAGLEAAPTPAASEPDQTAASDDTLAWLQSLATGSLPGDAVAPAPETERSPWEQETPATTAPPQDLPGPTPEPASEVSDWLKNMDTQDQGQATPVTPPLPEAVLPEATPPVQSSEPSPAPPVEDELPEWLNAGDSGQQSPANQADLPEWLRDQSADDQPPATAPAPAWVPAQDETVAPSSPVIVPNETASSAPVDSGSKVVVPGEEMPEPSGQFISFEGAVPEPTPPPAPVVAETPVPTTPVKSSTPVPPAVRQTGLMGDKDGPALQSARDLMAHGTLDAAIGEYSKLVKRGKFLEEVIYDLKEATYSHPVDVVIWQTLGDAYMRANQLQEALDAYTKAEELLR